jgi:MarR family transcriptional regulator, organic hydroperoxide resistance regulator
MGTGDSASDQMDTEILESMAELFASMLTRAEEVAQRFGVPIFFLKALQRLDCPMAMKDLGQRMRCDPSFVTNIADMLEKRGLATRESDPADRRVKRIVLTPAGMELRRRLENEIMANLPWRQALDPDERARLLGLLRKIVPAAAAQAGSVSHTPAKHSAAMYGEEVTEVLVSAPVSGADS